MAIATTTAWKPKNLPQKPEDSRSAKEKSIISTVEFVSPELPTISAIADANPITSTQAQEQQITQNLLEVLPPSQNEQDSQQNREKYLANKEFVGVGTVYIGGVEEGDAGVDGVVDEFDHFLFWLGRTMVKGQSHAAQSLF
ncbi:unnamed protein product [Ilex paraguariensis]|uniref:Uncharacterized protein n=1 Tax=Ilex paraguariensis TaxID=185542 RepID=A0ABC8SYM6_9AQUA